ILLSILVDIAIQLNVWRVLCVSGMRANELGNTVLPGLGWFLAVLVFVGGMVFNIGNIAGTGLGLNAMLGIDARIGGVIAAAIAIFIFLSKRAGVALDRIVAVLGAIMILLMLYVAIVSQPPLGEALKNTVMPEQIDFFQSFNGFFKPLIFSIIFYKFIFKGSGNLQASCFKNLF